MFKTKIDQSIFNDMKTSKDILPELSPKNAQIAEAEEKTSRLIRITINTGVSFSVCRIAEKSFMN